jgi:hypothetical protein
MTKSRNLIRPKWRPTPAQLEIVRQRFATTRTQDLADELGVVYSQVAKLANALGLHKSEQWLNGPDAGRTDGTKGLGTRFQKGQIPWSAGRKMGPQHALMTQFKPGHKPATWLPIGSLRIASGEYLQIKLSDTGYPPRDWAMYHRHVWEQAHGEIPPGHCIAFKPGRRSTDAAAITPDALECITKQEAMRRNSFHQYGPEIAGLVHTRAVLTRAINNRTRKA